MSLALFLCFNRPIRKGRAKFPRVRPAIRDNTQNLSQGMAIHTQFLFSFFTTFLAVTYAPFTMMFDYLLFCSFF